MDPNSSEFVPTINDLMNALRSHMDNEENIDTPMLEEALTSRESEKLARWFEETKVFLPSRSHPSAPSKPPFETAVGLLTAPIDQIADLFRKWPSRSDVKQAEDV